jgi:tetratricopeptide (TPR) repeat protein
LTFLVTACASTPPPKGPAPKEPEVRALDLSAEEKAFLVEPVAGFSGALAPERHDEILAAHEALMQEGDLDGAESLASRLLAADPDFVPAQVLAAQVEFARGDLAAVLRRLAPASPGAPGICATDYTACQLLIGRAAERSGKIPLAYGAYRSVAAKSPTAFARTGSLHAQALSGTRKRVDEELALGEIDVAKGQLLLLELWAPSEIATFEAAAAVAQAAAEPQAELAAMRKLTERKPDDRSLLERRADLEMDVGEPSAGLEIVKELSARFPRDPNLAARLEVTKFRWRLSALPPDVRGMAHEASLTRGELAVLFYWLIPNVRYAKPTAGRIAEDVLDQARQEEIVRVLNLGLMDVDGDLHRFFPTSPARRTAALGALVRALARFGKDLSCLGVDGGTCAVAARCGLLASVDDCRPRDPLSGAEAVEMIRLGLKALGAS